MQIKKFSLDQLEEVIEVEKQAFPKSPWPRSQFLIWHSSEPKGFLIAWERKVLGYCCISANGYIASIAVRKSARRRGIGKKLLKEASKRLRLKKLSAHVRVGNKPARDFYSNLGFEERERIKNFYPNNEDALLLEKEL